MSDTSLHVTRTMCERSRLAEAMVLVTLTVERSSDPLRLQRPYATCSRHMFYRTLVMHQLLIGMTAA